MLKHIVLIKLRENNEESYSALEALMLSMQESIPVIKNEVVSRNIVQTPVSFDMMLTIELDSPEALQAFISHPYHAEFIQKESEKYICELRLMDIVD